MVVRVDYVPAAGAVYDDGDSINPTKSPRGRVLTFVLRPDVRALCMICRRPLRVGVRLASAAALPVHEWPVGEPILVPRDRLRLYSPEEDSLVPIYSRKDGTSDFDDHILKAPPYMAAYPPHVRAAVRRSVEESEVSYQMWLNSGKRPTRDVVRAEMNSMRMRARAATSGLAPADDRL